MPETATRISIPSWKCMTAVHKIYTILDSMTNSTKKEKEIDSFLVDHRKSCNICRIMNGGG